MVASPEAFRVTLDLSRRTGKHDVGSGADEVRVQHEDRVLDMASGDILMVGTTTDRVYRYSNGGWDTGLAVPAGEAFPTGITVDPATGDILIVGSAADRVYRYSNGAWDS